MNARPATTRATLTTAASGDGAHSARCSEPVFPRSRTHTKNTAATEIDGHQRAERSTVRFVEAAITSQITIQAIQHAPITVIAPCRTLRERTDGVSLGVRW